MKKLILVRHAKSSWSDDRLQDIERPLSKRGLGNAPMMGMRLQEYGVSVERFYSSPAVRARSTAELMAVEMGFDPGAINVAHPLYTFNYEELLSWLRSLDSEVSRVAAVCHNPAVTDLVNFLALTHIDNIPTAGVVILNLQLSDWADVGAGMAELEEYNYPKREKA